MNITLYISNYDKTDIVKTFVAAKTWAFTNGQLRYPTNVLNPIIRVDFTGETITDEQKSCINYAYIPAFNRYYFIENIVMVTSVICDIYLHVDVLYTYIGRTGSPLRSTSVFVERSESTTYRNSLYPDERINIEHRNVYQYEQLSTAGVPPLKFKGNGTEDSGGHGRNVTVSLTYNNAADISFNMSPEVTTTTESNVITPRYHATGSGFVVYVLTKDQLVQLLREFLVDDTKASFVRSICIWPFDLPTANLLQDSSTGQLKYGNNQTFTFTGDANLYVYRTTDVDSYKYFSITNFAPSGISIDTYLKMNGYATWSMYLPYIGWVDYDSSIMLEGKKLEVFYDFNFDNASCECHVFFDGKIIINKDCDMGIKVPVNTTNQYEINQRRNAITTQEITTMIAGLIMIFGGLALTSTGAGAVGGVPMMVGGGGTAAAAGS